MKKRIIYAFTIAILLIAMLINIYLEIQYDINVLEYFTKSRKLTKEEEKWLTEHKKLIYGSDQSSPPLRYIDERNGQYRGLVVDYIMALSIELQTEISFEPVRWWGDALNSLENNEKDFFDMIASKDRLKQFDFSDPIYSLRGTILIPKNTNKIDNYSDLEGKRVAIPRGDYAVEFLNERVKNIHYELTPDMTGAILQLRDGNVDAVVGDEPVITYLVDKLNMRNEYRTLEKAIYEEDSVLAVKKSEKILLSILNKGIYNLKKKRVMANIQKKWFGMSDSFAKENTSSIITILILSFISIIGLVLYLFYSWNRILKREVEKRTEELYLSRHDLQVTFDGLTHLMIVIDKDHNIVNVNKAFCRLLGLKKKQVQGKKCTEFKEILYGHGVESIIKDTFSTGKQYQKEFKYRNKIFQTSTFPLDDRMKNIRNVLIMVKDVTKLRISEQQLLQDNKMRAIGQLAAGVAHEIRNPLGLIRTYCYILKNNPNNEENKIKKAIRVIENSVERGSKIVDNLLNFSRISSNDCEKINIRGFIVDIFLLQQKVLEKNNIAREIFCDEGLVRCVNQESLKHILVNLISNAIDAMPNGGIIKMECKEKKNKLSITFIDNGIGIKEQNLEKIFNPFFTTKMPGRGTGLGLYIVYNEVLKYGGTINVTSKLGEGTSFYIMLPLGGEEKDETN